MKKTFNILSLDGGGYKGLCTIACLAELEKKYGVKCHDIFDMFAGTSTGSIIALALANGESAQNMLDFYETIGDKVFPNKIIGSRMLRNIREFFFPKYRNVYLKKELDNLFGSIKVKDIQEKNKYIIVPTLCLSNGCPRIFKTDHRPEYNQHNEYFLSDISLSSCSAPVFFPISKIKIPGSSTHELFVDGGLFANNPSVCALIEAQQHINKDINDIRLISIATPNFSLAVKENKFFPKMSRYKGIIQWNEKLISMALQGTAMRDDYVAKFMLTDSRYLRLNPEINLNTPNEMDLTDKNSKIQLIYAGKQLAINNFNNQVIKEIFNQTEVSTNGKLI